MKKDILKRVLCLACCLSLTLGMFAYRPTKAEAVFASPAVAFGASLVASAVVATTAQLFVSTGAAETVGTAIDGLVTEFISAVPEYMEYTTDTFFAAVADGAVLLETGAIQLSAAAGNLTARFINWLQGDKGIEAGGEPVSIYSELGSFVLQDGTVVVPYAASEAELTAGYSYVSQEVANSFCIFDAYTTYYLANGNSFKLNNGNLYMNIWDSDGNKIYSTYMSRKSPGILYVAESVPTHPEWEGPIYWFATYSQDNKGHRLDFPIGNASFIQYFGFNSSSVSAEPRAEFQTLPNVLPDYSALVVNPAVDALDITDQQGAADSIMAGIAAGTLSPTVSVEAQATDVPGTDADDDVIVVPGQDAELLDWTKYIGQKVAAIPQAIADAIAGIFVPDAALVNEITGTFSAKFGFVETLKTIGDDLFGMTPSTEPPVVWIHLEDAEGKYTYGGTVKALDMSWYQRYKADMDRILGGFLWLAYLWLLFRRLPDILGGAGLVIADGMYIDTIHGPSGEGFMFRRSKRL